MSGPSRDPRSDKLGELVELLLAQLAARISERLEHTLTDHTAAVPAAPWLGIQAAARHLGWPKQRLYKLTAQGAIPHYKHEGRLVFHRGELDAWLHEHAQPYRPMQP
jgi:excisionase family DNA binding protein